MALDDDEFGDVGEVECATPKERMEAAMDGKNYMVYIIGVTMISVIQGIVSVFESPPWFDILEYIFLFVFSLDVICRLWAR